MSISNNNNNNNNNNNAATTTAVGNSVFFSNNNNNNNNYAGVSSNVETASATAENRINLGALQQRDPYIIDILGCAKQVALYLFKENEWERTSIEGSLFVYKRSASPHFGFMVLNRLKPNNLIEPIEKNLEFQIQKPFLLYRTSKEIKGIWFYERKECSRISKLVTYLLRVTIAIRESKSQMRRHNNASKTTSKDQPAVESVDVMKLLSKAQRRYNKMKEIENNPFKPMTDSPGESIEASSIICPTPFPLPTSSKSTNIEANDPHEGNRPFNTLVNKNYIQSSDKLLSQLSSYLKRISSSVSMVEDLEREHRNDQQEPSGMMLQQASSNTAINIPPSSSSSSSELPDQSSSSDNQSSPNLIQPSQFSHLGRPSTIQSSLPRSQSSDENLSSPQSSISVQHNYQPNTEERPVFPVSPKFFFPLGGTETGTNSSNRPTSLSSRGGNSATFNHTRLPTLSMGKSGTPNLLTPVDMEIVPASDNSVSGKFGCNEVDSNNLLSPMDFVSQIPTISPSTSSNNISDTAKDESNVTPLTKEQLQVSLLYLLKNDSNFVSKIHEAYVLSLSAMISNQKT